MFVALFGVVDALLFQIQQHNFRMVMSLILAFVLTGCTDKLGDMEEKYVYQESIIPFEGMEGLHNLILYENDRLYVNTYVVVQEHVEDGVQEKEQMKGLAKLYTVKLNGNDLKEIPLDALAEGYIFQMAVGEDRFANIRYKGGEKSDISLENALSIMNADIAAGKYRIRYLLFNCC